MAIPEGDGHTSFMVAETASFAPICSVRDSMWFRSAGRLTGDEKYLHRLPKGVPSPTIFLTFQGKGRFRVGDGSWSAGTQTATILFPSRLPAQWRGIEGGWGFYWLTCFGAHCLPYLEQFGFGGNQREKKIEIGIFNELEHLFSELIAVGRTTTAGSKFQYQKIATNLMLTLLEAWVPHGKKKPGPKIYEQDVFATVDRYLARVNPAPDRVDEVAQLFRSTPEHVSRVFKNTVGISLKDYMIHFRINQAKRLLAETTVGIEAIGERVGYPDIYHFSKLFKVRVGQSPSNFRKHYWH